MTLACEIKRIEQKMTNKRIKGHLGFEDAELYVFIGDDAEQELCYPCYQHIAFLGDALVKTKRHGH